MLKTRIREAEQQKAKAEEELVEVRFAGRDKLKKVREEMQKKLLQQEELHAGNLLHIAREAKEIKFKY
jgi:hypothetical protein